MRVIFNKKLLGFEDYTAFNLSLIPDSIYQPVHVLINETGAKVSFMMMNVQDFPELRADVGDLQDAPYGYLNNPKTVACFTLLKVQAQHNDICFTANLRAPLFIDLKASCIEQFILSPKYTYDYPLTDFSAQVNTRRASIRVRKACGS